MSETNSLMNMPKRDLAAQHERLVLALMRLWCVRHPMSNWRDPLSAVEALYAEAALMSTTAAGSRGGVARDCGHADWTEDFAAHLVVDAPAGSRDGASDIGGSYDAPANEDAPTGPPKEL